MTREAIREIIDRLMGKVRWELDCANKMVLQQDRNLSIGKAYGYERAAEMLANLIQEDTVISHD